MTQIIFVLKVNHYSDIKLFALKILRGRKTGMLSCVTIGDFEVLFCLLMQQMICQFDVTEVSVFVICLLLTCLLLTWVS